MSKGIGVLVGLKSVDPLQYNGWNGENGCWGCELDVDNVHRILVAMGYQTNVLKTAEATHDRILETLGKVATKVGSDDIVVFYYSGHGGQQPDFNSPQRDERDGQDETLVAYDREIIDDELNKIWLQFPKGTRIVMISDSCNSGTNYRNGGNFISSTLIIPVLDEQTEAKMNAQLIHFGGCRDGFTSSGYHGGGAFTMALCNAWANGSFEGNYRQLLEKAGSLVTSSQIPQYNEYGSVTEAFRNSRPFQVSNKARVSMNLTLNGDDFSTVKEALSGEFSKALLNAVKQTANARPCSVSATGSSTSGGNWSVSGSVSCTF